MKKALPQSETMFGPQIIEILRSGCATPETRLATIKDPRALLAQHGIELPGEGELRIYERATVGKAKSPRNGGGVSEPLFDRALRQYEDLQPIPHSLDQAWRDSHGGCPYGTVPYKTKKKVTKCLMWGIWVSGKEWIQDVPGTPFGHFNYNTLSFCILSMEEEVEVTECLPYLSGPQP